LLVGWEKLTGSVIPLFLALFFFFPFIFSRGSDRLLFAPFTTWGTLIDIVPLDVSVAQLVGTRGTSLEFPIQTLLGGWAPLSLGVSPTQLPSLTYLLLSPTHQEVLLTLYTSVQQMLPCVRHVQQVFAKFLYQLLVSQYKILSLHILTTYSVYIAVVK